MVHLLRTVPNHGSLDIGGAYQHPSDIIDWFYSGNENGELFSSENQFPQISGLTASQITKYFPSYFKLSKAVVLLEGIVRPETENTS